MAGMHFWGHLYTITRHKLIVMRYCFRVGLYKQGILHDLSKYSPTEFMVGVKYYTGTKSPNAVEREKKGYSDAWLHHKGRNKHHLEYWIDYGGPRMEMMGYPMPTRYMVELCLDRIAACRVYNGKAYKQTDPLGYFQKSNDTKMMHPDTKKCVERVLRLLAENGEEAMFDFLKKILSGTEEILADGESKQELTEKQLVIPKREVLSIVEKIQTPFYLYDESGICATIETVNQAFSWKPNHKQFFPVKATPTAGILQVIRRAGNGVVCSSAAELLLCKKSGFEAEDILFLPNYPKREDVEMAAQIGCQAILDGVDQLEQFIKAGISIDTIGVRLISDKDFLLDGGHIKFEDCKFGMTVSQFVNMVPQLRKTGVKNVGVHAYFCGNTLSANYYPELVDFLCTAAVEIEQYIPIAYIDISGGIGIPYEGNQKKVDLLSIGAEVRRRMEVGLPAQMMHRIGLYTELGRLITGPNAILVSKVTSIKRSHRNYAGIDASAADLMRPMLYGAYHHISLCNDADGRIEELWDVVGSICENTDKFAVNRKLPTLQKNDIIAIHDVGAHGHSMGYNYSGRLRCAEYLRTVKGETCLVRRAETIEDYLDTQCFFS